MFIDITYQISLCIDFHMKVRTLIMLYIINTTAPELRVTEIPNCMLTISLSKPQILYKCLKPQIFTIRSYILLKKAINSKQ